MCGQYSSKPADYIPVTRESFPEPNLPAWQQVFSERHRRQIALNTIQGAIDDVHPVFNKSNFSNLSASTGLKQLMSTWLDPANTMPALWYENIKPALALASRLLYFSSGFFGTLLYGKIEGCEVDGGKVHMVYDRQNIERYDPRFSYALNRLSNIQFFCGPSDNNDNNNHGRTERQVYPQFLTPNMATVAVQINSKLVAFFAHPNYHIMQQELKDRLLVLLGIILVHELAHAWFGFMSFEVARQGGDEESSELCWLMRGREPYFFHSERHNELGYSWEHFAFGGRLDLYCRRGVAVEMDALSSLAGADSVALTGIQEDSADDRVSCVHPRLVSALLNKKCWNEYSILFGYKRFAERAPEFGYEKLSGNGIFQQMEMVAALQTFRETHGGRWPESNELALELVGAKLIEILGGYKKGQSVPQSIEIPPTPPPTPPSEEDAEEREAGSSLDIEIETIPTGLGDMVDPVTAWQKFANANKQVALESGYLRA